MLELCHRDHPIRISRTPVAGEVMVSVEVHFSERAMLTSYRRMHECDDAEAIALMEAIALVDGIVDGASTPGAVNG